MSDPADPWDLDAWNRWTGTVQAAQRFAQREARLTGRATDDGHGYRWFPPGPDGSIAFIETPRVRKRRRMPDPATAVIIGTVVVVVSLLASSFR